MNSPALATAVAPAKQILVDPAIAAVIIDPSAPRGVPARVLTPSTLPGEVGGWPAARALYGGTRHGIEYSEQLHTRHGEIYRGMYALEPVVFLWDADEVQRMVRNEASLWSTGMGWDLMFFGNMTRGRGNFGGLLSMDFDTHKAARKLVQPAFTSKALKGYTEIAALRIDPVLTEWLQRGQVAFKPAVRRLLADVASRIFTGIEDPATVATMDKALSDFWHGPLSLIKDPRFGPSFRKALRGLDTLEQIFTALVPRRRSAPGEDLFSHMCQVQDLDGAGDGALVYVFLTIMFGAFDTTSLGVTSMAYLLAKHPEWQERLRAEALQIPTGQLDWGGLQKLEQLEWVWKETLRLLPLNSGLPRRALRDVELLGHKLAAGSFVAPMTGAMGRHPKWWNEPTRFDPERFSPARAEEKKHPAIYLPFGGGAHACVGMQLANLEVKLLFHALLTRCRFELSEDYEARHTFTPLGCVSGQVALKLTPL